MRLFLPDLRAADPSGMERLGGAPFGLPPERWPRCAECGRSQSLLAQFAHHPDRLDLGREGRALLVFMCGHEPGMCDTWEAFSGANAAFVVEPDGLSGVETPPPADGPPLERHATIAGWIERDDAVAPEQAEAFFGGASFFALDDAVAARASGLTRLGGVPCWIQSPDEAPSPGWRFVGQLDSGYGFFSDDAPEWASPDPERWEGRTHWAEGPNFGGGIAYLFRRDASDPPEFAFFWQCG